MADNSKVVDTRTMSRSKKPAGGLSVVMVAGEVCGKEPMRTTHSDIPCLNFHIAFKSAIANSDYAHGPLNNRVAIRVVVFNIEAEAANALLEDGSPVVVHGELSFNGFKRIFEIKAHSINLIPDMTS